MQIHNSIKFTHDHLLVVGLVWLVVAMGHLPASAVDAGHQPGRDGLHHLPQHVFLAVQFLPGCDDSGPQLWFRLWLQSLDFVFEDSPNLKKE